MVKNLPPAPKTFCFSTHFVFALDTRVLLCYTSFAMKNLTSKMTHNTIRLPPPPLLLCVWRITGKKYSRQCNFSHRQGAGTRLAGHCRAGRTHLHHRVAQYSHRRTQQTVQNSKLKIRMDADFMPDTPPANPQDLRDSFYTKRKKDLMEFPFEDSGKTAYFAVQIENEGKKGPWGPMVSALIP